MDLSYELTQAALIVLQDAGALPTEPTPALLKAAGRMRVVFEQVLAGKNADEATDAVKC